MSSARRSWRAFRALSGAERWLLARTLVLLPLTAASLRILGFGRTQALLAPAAGAAPGRQDLPAAQSIARIVNGAAPWSPLHANCLPRAVVLCRLLSQQGMQAELKLGVARPGGEFSAHAWVEHAGVALAEPDGLEQRFAAIGGPAPNRGL
jgi:hypothetical protein